MKFKATLLALCAMLPAMAGAQFAPTPISNLPQLSTLTGTELYPLQQSNGTSASVSSSNIAGYVLAQLNSSLVAALWTGCTGAATVLGSNGTCIVPGSGTGVGNVVTTGTPISGNLAMFSGGTSITNSDLSGDCTTSGTLAITCLKTNGVAFGNLATANGASPPALGGTTPAAGTFTALNATTALEFQGVQVPSFPRTAAEISAGITPMYYSYAAENVLRYGADPTGSSFSTTAIQNAINVAEVSGGQPFLPCGTYKVASALVITSPNLYVLGSGPCTVITTTSATADIFDVEANYVTLSDMLLTSSATRTAGYFVNLNTAVSNINVVRVSMTNFYNAFGITGAGPVGVITFRDSNLTANVAGGAGVTVNTTTPGVDILFDGITVAGASSGVQLGQGFLIENSGDITLRHVLTTWAGTGLDVTVLSGDVVQLLMVSDSEFDSGSSNGVTLTSVGTGAIQLAKFSNVWSAGNSSGFSLGGTILSSQFVNLNGLNNTVDGFVITSTSVADTTVSNSFFSGNVTGMLVTPDVTKFYFNGNVVGPSGQGAANTYGINIQSGTSNEFAIIGNDVCGNSTSSDDFINGATGATFSVSGNLCVTTAGTATSGFGTTPSVVGTSYAAFRITVGSTGTPSTSTTVTFPYAAATGWNCTAYDVTHPTYLAVPASGGSTTTCLQTWSTAPANNDVLYYQANQL